MRDTAIKIVKRLQDAGFQAYFAGGCVRDQLLGVTPKDYDITTNARPNEVEKLFERTLEIGKAFGVTMIIENGIQFEIATFRAEHGYSDGRRPDEVTFSDTPEEDVIRRDFTINGMLYDPILDVVLDFVNGKKDLRDKVVAAIGSPDIRFDEDHLRMMRAIRFSVQLGFDLEFETQSAIARNSWKLVRISKERIRDELVKIVTSREPAIGMRTLHFTGLINNVMVEIRPLTCLAQGRYHNKDAYEHTMDVLNTVPAKMELRMAALLHDIGKPKTRAPHEHNEYSFYGHEEVGEEMTKEILQGLKFSNDEIAYISKLVGLHMGLRGARKKVPSDRSLRKFARKCGSEEMLNDALTLMMADFAAHPGNDPSEMEDIILRFRSLKINGEQPTAKQKVVSGKDIMEALSIPEGKEVGVHLKKVQEMLDENPNLTKEEILKSLNK